jgi:methylmalonyl-CoA mutase cobalamin-binding subunit
MRSIVATSRKQTRPASGWITIGSLARATGIPASTLRTWERRYRVPLPTRKASGHRLYPVEAVRHVRAIRRVLDRGRTPAEVMRLPVEALERLANESWLEAPEARTPRRPAAAAPSAQAPSAGDAERDPSVGALLVATLGYDGGALRRAFADAWIRLGPIGTLEKVAAPFLHEVGAAWAEGRLTVRHEHFASMIAADFLREVRRPFDARAGGPWLAVATLEDDLHEIGLLSVALVASIHGWRVAYLGPDTPPAEIAAFAEDAGVRAVAISVSRSRGRGAVALLRSVRGALPAGIDLWTGGEGAPAGAGGTVRLERLADLVDRLQA